MPDQSQLCSVTELIESVNQGKPNLRILDSSWYLPSDNIDSEAAFIEQHIPGAVFFHIDLICDRASDLPHMLPSSEDFATAVGELGINNNHEIVVYDTAGLFSAARVWWMFKVFGHQNVRVLDGGLPAWLAAGGELSNTQSQHDPDTFSAKHDAELVTNKAQLIDNSQSKSSLVLDARPTPRFLGQAAEPRPGLPSGHMPNSKSLPFAKLLNEGKLKTPSELTKIFSDLGVSNTTKLITSCGSGVTAAIITLALTEAGYGMHSLYDGAWTEWASAEDTIVLTE